MKVSRALLQTATSAALAAISRVPAERRWDR